MNDNQARLHGEYCRRAIFISNGIDKSCTISYQAKILLLKTPFLFLRNIKFILHISNEDSIINYSDILHT